MLNEKRILSDEELILELESIKMLDISDFTEEQIFNTIYEPIQYLIEEVNRNYTILKHITEKFFFGNTIEIDLKPFSLAECLSTMHKEHDVWFIFGLLYNGQYVFEDLNGIELDSDIGTPYGKPTKKTDDISKIIAFLHVTLKGVLFEIQRLIRRFQSPLKAQATTLILYKVLEDYLTERNINKTSRYSKQLGKIPHTHFKPILEFDEAFTELTGFRLNAISKDLHRYLKLTPLSLSLDFKIDITKHTPYLAGSAEVVNLFIDYIDDEKDLYHTIDTFDYLDKLDDLSDQFFRSQGFPNTKQPNVLIGNSYTRLIQLGYIESIPEDIVVNYTSKMKENNNILVLSCLRITPLFLTYDSCKEVLLSIFRDINVQSVNVYMKRYG